MSDKIPEGGIGNLRINTSEYSNRGNILARVIAGAVLTIVIGGGTAYYLHSHPSNTSPQTPIVTPPSK